MVLSKSDTGSTIRYSGNINVQNDLQSKSKKWLEVFQANVESAIGAMADSIKAKAQMTVPFKNGDLHDSARVEGSGLSREVIFGGNGIAYGAYQERGMRKDGTYVVTHYTTAGTGSHYLENATEIVLKEGIKRYLK